MQTLLLGFRKENKETQGQVAKLLGIGEEAYRQKELGRSEFKMNEMFTLAQHYNVRVEEIFLPRKST